MALRTFLGHSRPPRGSRQQFRQVFEPLGTSENIVWKIFYLKSNSFECQLEKGMRKARFQVTKNTKRVVSNEIARCFCRKAKFAWL